MPVNAYEQIIRSSEFSGVLYILFLHLLSSPCIRTQLRLQIHNALFVNIMPAKPRVKKGCGFWLQKQTAEPRIPGSQEDRWITGLAFYFNTYAPVTGHIKSFWHIMHLLAIGDSRTAMKTPWNFSKSAEKQFECHLGTAGVDTDNFQISLYHVLTRQLGHTYIAETLSVTS